MSEVEKREKIDEIDWQILTKEEKQKALYLKQKRLLDTFLSNHAISIEQYKKSLGDLTVKMGMEGVDDGNNI